MECGACTTTDAGAVLHDVAYYPQYMSPGMIEGIVYDRADPGEDPHWPRSGAATRGEYVRWCGHCCGMACLQMILDHARRRVPSLLELQRGCTEYGGYVERADGRIKGLIYAPFAAFAGAELGLDAQVRPRLDLCEVPGLLADGYLVMASVHREIRRPREPAPGRGGHLVLITGHNGGRLRFNNPSGHTPEARRAEVSMETFERFFAGRGIAVR